MWLSQVETLVKVNQGDKKADKRCERERERANIINYSSRYKMEASEDRRNTHKNKEKKMTLKHESHKKSLLRIISRQSRKKKENKSWATE